MHIVQHYEEVTLSVHQVGLAVAGTPKNVSLEFALARFFLQGNGGCP